MFGSIIIKVSEIFNASTVCVKTCFLSIFKNSNQMV